MLFIIFILLSLIFYSALHYRPHLISLGNFKFAKYSKIDSLSFYIEEVEFNDSQAAIHGYFNIVPMLQNRAEVLESSYDFFDFYTVVLRFEDCTLKLVRQLNKVRLIKSEFPVGIAEFEQLIVPIAYNNQK